MPTSHWDFRPYLIWEEVLTFYLIRIIILYRLLNIDCDFLDHGLHWGLGFSALARWIVQSYAWLSDIIITNMVSQVFVARWISFVDFFLPHKKIGVWFTPWGSFIQALPPLILHYGVGTFPFFSKYSGWILEDFLIVDEPFIWDCLMCICQK